MAKDEQRTILEEWMPCTWHTTKVTVYVPIEGVYRFVAHEIKLSDNGDGTAIVHISRDVTYLIGAESRDEAARKFRKASNGY